MRRVVLVLMAAAVSAVAIGWFVAARLPRWLNDTEPAPTSALAPTTVEEARKIRATLFYVSKDGTHLVAVPREVPFAESAPDQARRLVEAQLAPAPEPYASPLPQGTTVRAVFITDRQDAFVDLGGSVVTNHTGGSLDEIFSVYAIVNALTMNLPAVTRVQILIDGKEVESLAGHVDLRRPLPRNLTWVAEPATEPEAPAEGARP